MIDAIPVRDRHVIVSDLARARPRSRFLRRSGIALSVIVAYSWAAGDWRLAEFLSAERLTNLRRFIGELAPYPLQSRPWSWSIAFDWFAQLMAAKGWRGALTTLAISVAAIVLAGTAGIALSFPATRTLATHEPYLPSGRPPSRGARAAWTSLVALTRGFLTFLRAVPEYVWAFLFVAALGPNVWAAVFALAVHNAGILGRLDAEVIENLNADTLEALRALGARRRHIALTGVFPAAVPRFLLLFLYRWEMCVREASVVGLLGIVSLGFYIQDARARQHYDVMLALILVGSVVVLIGDLISAAARGAIRRHS